MKQIIDAKDFLKKQKDIYDKFRFAQHIMMRDGLSISRNARERDGYLVVLRHPKNIAKPCSRFSKRIADTIPSIVYNEKNIHTTILMHEMQYRPAKEHSLDESIVKNLIKNIHPITKDLRSVSIDYENWLYNDNSVIVRGFADEDFIYFSNQILNSCQDLGEIKRPWSGHITASRFLEESAPEELSDFLKLIKESPKLGTSKPEYLDIAYVNVKSGKINVETQERFNLK